METPQAIQLTVRVGGAFWLKWVLAYAITLAISVVPAFIYPGVNEAIGATLGRNAAATIVSMLALLSGILIAILAGMLQWLVLRQHVRWANQWWLATSVGWIAGGFLAPYAAFAVLGARPPTLSFNAVTAPVSAAVVGILQWLVLRRRVRRAGWWVLASIASWVIGERLGLYVGFELAMRAGGAAYVFGQDLASIAFSASFEAVIGAMAGSMTGIVLVWLLRHPYVETQ